MAATVSAVASAVTALAAVFALLIYSLQLRHQALSREFTTYQEFTRDVGVLWSNYIQSDARFRRFHLGQLLAFYESVCHLYNRGFYGAHVRDLVRDHLLEVLVRLILDDEIRGEIHALNSGPNTNAEIIRFFKENKSEYEAHWQWLASRGATSPDEPGKDIDGGTQAAMLPLPFPARLQAAWTTLVKGVPQTR